MKQKIQYFDTDKNHTYETTFSNNRECPRCKTPMVPAPIYGVAYQNNSGKHFTVLQMCPNCSTPYLATYKSQHMIGDSYVLAAQFISAEPNSFSPHKFDEQIEEVSMSFAEIYNQALNAESMGLDQIAGIGYRKSVEFLIKDFAVFLHPENKDEIIAFPLSKCIQNYIDNPIIKNLAQKCTWLGNDEAHYIKKHTDRDINDLKKLIDATVHFISMFLIAKDAETIFPA